MYKYYRKKIGGLCYKLIAEKVRPYNSTPKNIIADVCNTFVIIQHQNSDPYYLTTKQFWEEFEGVEDKDLPPVYRERPLQTRISAEEFVPAGYFKLEDAAKFRKEQLAPALRIFDVVTLDLNCVGGWTSAPLKEMFGGLVSEENFTESDLARLVLIAEDKSVPFEAQGYIKEALENKKTDLKMGGVPGIGDGTLVR